jgi:hypothetical protein
VIILDPSVWYLYEWAKNICIDNITAKVAINDLDDDICENIEDQDIKNYCEEEIIYQKELKDSESKVNEMVPAWYKEGENALSQ